MAQDLQRFLGGNSSKKHDYSNFLVRLNQEPQSISENEVEDRYRELLQHASPNLVAEAYQHVVGNLAPEQRRQMAEQYSQANQNSNSPFDGFQFSSIQQAAEPKNLGLMAQQAAQQDPGLFDQLFGPNSPLRGPLGRLVLTGIVAYLANRVLTPQAGQGQPSQQPIPSQSPSMPSSQGGGLGGGLLGALGGLIGVLSQHQQQSGQIPSAPSAPGGLGGLGSILDVLTQHQQQQGGGQTPGIPGGLGGILDILTGGQQSGGLGGLGGDTSNPAPSPTGTPGLHVKGSQNTQ